MTRDNGENVADIDSNNGRGGDRKESNAGSDDGGCEDNRHCEHEICGVDWHAAFLGKTSEVFGAGENTIS